MKFTSQDFLPYYKKLLDYCRGILYRKSQPKHHAEDIVQDTYLKFHKYCKHKEFDSKNHLNSILHKMIRDAFADSRTQVMRHTLDEISGGTTDMLSRGENARVEKLGYDDMRVGRSYNKGLQDLELQDTYAIIESIPGKQQRFVLKEKMSGKRNIDISREHGIIPSNVSTYLTLGKAKLRVKLDP